MHKPRTFAGTLPQHLPDQATLERRIAERAVICDIESECPTISVDGITWRDTRPMLDPREHAPEIIDMATEALEYAEARLLISCHPLQRHLVRVLVSA